MRDEAQVFLSYARGDEPLAEAVAGHLLENGIQVWTERELGPGERWVEAINHAVRDSEAFVVLLSPSFEKSGHGMAELGFIMSEQRDSGKPFVPVDVGGAKPLLSREHFQTVDARGLLPDQVAERVMQEVTRQLAEKPTTAE